MYENVYRKYISVLHEYLFEQIQIDLRKDFNVLIINSI